MKSFSKAVALAIAMLSISAVASAEGKIDPLLMIMADRPDEAVSTMKSFGSKSMDGVAMADVIIKARYGYAEQAKDFIESLGGTVRVVIGEIMTASIPLEAIAALDDSELIENVEASKPMSPKMNVARSSVGSSSDQVQAGTCASCAGTAYTGTGVIVGVIDTGIDCQHADFKVGGVSTGATRIINYYDQYTGTDYTAAQLSDGSCSASADTNGHGTHVTGIAAGSNATYTGNASTADIISVKNGSSDAKSGGNFSVTLLEAANYIFNKADALGKAAVINISQGTSLGAHDGTSLLEQGLDALLTSSGTDRQSRAIVNAAGNENIATYPAYTSTMGGIHAPISVEAGTPRWFEVSIMTEAASTSIINNYSGATIDFWLDSGAGCTVEAKGYRANGSSTFTTGAIPFGAATATATDNFATVTLSYASTDTTSGKKHGTILINRASESVVDTILFPYYFLFILSGTCNGNAWLYPDQAGLIDFTKVQQGPDQAGITYAAGDSNMTITIPGTASKIITVASYMDRETWVDMNGVTQNESTGTCDGVATGSTDLNISTFSSLGPTASTTAADQQKPDIAAPGEPILSTLSSSVSASTCAKGDATHYKLEGTSMASPHVAGIVALMFQKNKCLTGAEVKTYLRNSATSDTHTGAVPSYNWGYGKVNAASVMGLFEPKSTCSSPTPTPSTSSSCSLTGEGKKALGVSDLIAFIAVSVLSLALVRSVFARRRAMKQKN